MYKVFRGIKNFRNVGRVISFDGDTEMDAWQGEECNKYKGTDSTIFPPLMSKEEGIWAYEPTLCLSLGAYYIGPSKYMGIPTLRYTIDFGDQKVCVLAFNFIRNVSIIFANSLMQVASHIYIE